MEGVQVADDAGDGPLDEAIVWTYWEGRERLVERRNNEQGLWSPEEIESQQLVELLRVLLRAEDF